MTLPNTSGTFVGQYIEFMHSPEYIEYANVGPDVEFMYSPEYIEYAKNPFNVSKYVKFMHSPVYIESVKNPLNPPTYRWGTYGELPEYMWNQPLPWYDYITRKLNMTSVPGWDGKIVYYKNILRLKNPFKHIEVVRAEAASRKIRKIEIKHQKEVDFEPFPVYIYEPDFRKEILREIAIDSYKDFRENIFFYSNKEVLRDVEIETITDFDDYSFFYSKPDYSRPKEEWGRKVKIRGRRKINKIKNLDSKVSSIEYRYTNQEQRKFRSMQINRVFELNKPKLLYDEYGPVFEEELSLAKIIATPNLCVSLPKNLVPASNEGNFLTTFKMKPDTEFAIRDEFLHYRDNIRVEFHEYKTKTLSNFRKKLNQEFELSCNEYQNNLRMLLEERWKTGQKLKEQHSKDLTPGELNPQLRVPYEQRFQNWNSIWTAQNHDNNFKWFDYLEQRRQLKSKKLWKWITRIRLKWAKKDYKKSWKNMHIRHKEDRNQLRYNHNSQIVYRLNHISRLEWLYKDYHACQWRDFWAAHKLARSELEFNRYKFKFYLKQQYFEMYHRLDDEWEGIKHQLRYSKFNLDK